MKKIEAIVTSMLTAAGLYPSRFSTEVENFRTATVEDSIAKDWQNVGADIAFGIETEREANLEIYGQAS